LCYLWRKDLLVSAHTFKTHTAYSSHRLIRFGGTDGQYHYNDTWAFDVPTRTWSELSCIGFIPVPREGHAAALVDDVMYVFGGRGVDGKDLGDLAAFKISSKWSHLDVCKPHTNIYNSRFPMVYVPEHGSFPKWSFRTCHGSSWVESLCSRWRVLHCTKAG
jgi:hypothetical protein